MENDEITKFNFICTKERCLKEVNPKVFPGVYFGKPFEFNENEGACYLCGLGEKGAFYDREAPENM